MNKKTNESHIKLTIIGQKRINGMLATALPASLNKTITSFIRFRKKITVNVKTTVIIVEAIANPRNIFD